MNTLTYPEAYNKIIEAYFKDEIQPLDAHFCFCGTLCNNSSGWFGLPRALHYPLAGYSGDDFVKMERALLDTMSDNPDERFPYTYEKNYEELLFKGMSAALDVLKEIHRSRGENVDEGIPAFTKRKLTKTDIEVVVNN